MTQLVYPKLSYLIRGACFEVYNQLGFGHKEKLIENALCHELELREIPFERQKRVTIYFKGKKVGTYVPDILVEDKVILELKSKEYLSKTDEQQFWHYMKNTSYKLGFLINFGPQLKIIRRVY